MQNDSERLLLELSEQDRIQQQIRLLISSFKTTESDSPRHRGAAYASHPVSSGLRLYKAMRRFGFTNPAEFKQAAPQRYRKLVMEPNIEAGRRFGDFIRSHGWPLTIVPGNFYATGWTQIHYMAAWRPVIVYRVKTLCHDHDIGYTTGGVEEFKIGILNHKRILFREANRLIPADLRLGADRIRKAIEQLASWGMDPKDIYQHWQEIDLLIDEVLSRKRRSIAVKTG